MPINSDGTVPTDNTNTGGNTGGSTGGNTGGSTGGNTDEGTDENYDEMDEIYYVPVSDADIFASEYSAPTTPVDAEANCNKGGGS